MRSPAKASGGGRSPSTTSRKSKDSWDVSQNSVSSRSSGCSKSSSSSSSSSLSSALSRRNPVTIAARAIGSCFGPPAVRSERGDFSEDFTPPPLTSSRNPYGSSSGNTTPREPGSVRFTMAEIHKATKKFSPDLKVGQGGSGTVYKGQLDDGTLVAVKRAKKSIYDSHLSGEFQSEIQTLARVEHLNLVRFYGFVEYEDERILVVEYVPNGTLREHLDCRRGKPLDFAARLDIAIDVAHAVTYLHMYSEHPIIHRDIKSSNILITDNLRAKVADFGFARFAENDSGATHVSTQVKGTAGYLDPEYLRTYQLTTRSDVFSFGVLLVELVSGRRPIESKRVLEERVTAKWAVKNFTEGNAMRTLDPNLSRNAATNLAVERIFELVLQCLAPTRKTRPSMRRCAEILWNIRKDYRELVSSDSLAQPSHQGKTTLNANEGEES